MVEPEAEDCGRVADRVDWLAWLGLSEASSVLLVEAVLACFGDLGLVSRVDEEGLVRGEMLVEPEAELSLVSHVPIGIGIGGIDGIAEDADAEGEADEKEEDMIDCAEPKQK